MYPEIENSFFDPPIRELPLHYVQDWFFAATKPQVSLHLSRYLLPRVMELLAEGHHVASAGLEVSLKRFATGLSDRWTAPETEVITRFARLFLDRFRQSDPAPAEDLLDDALCMFGCAGHDPRPLLAHIWGWSDGDLFGRLASDWASGGNHMPSPWSTAFWVEDAWSLPGQAERAKCVADWYRSPEMSARAERAWLDPDVNPNLQRHAELVLCGIENAD